MSEKTEYFHCSAHKIDNEKSSYKPNRLKYDFHSEFFPIIEIVTKSYEH